jgi:GH24 family phage-related lysozyme (muramidase)
MSSFELWLRQWDHAKASTWALRSGVSWNNPSPAVPPNACMVMKPLSGLVAASPPPTVAANNISDAGMTFLYREEAQKNVSDRLHWPKFGSGVTLGPGYDLKERKEDAIIADLQGIGLDKAIAKAIAGGAGKTGQDAKKFCDDNAKLVVLTAEQETALLKLTLPDYIRRVRNKVTIDLRQHQFDALVSFTYNVWGPMHAVGQLLNAGKEADAMTMIRSHDVSNGEVVAGLTARRGREVNLYLNGIYGTGP